MGLGDARRGQGDRAPHALPQRHGVLRAHSPGAPFQDRAHRASRREGPDVPAPASGLAAQARAAALGQRPSLPRAWLAQRRGRGAARRVQDHRVSRRTEGMTRRMLLRALAGATLAALGVGALAQKAPRVVRVGARKFSFTTNVLTLKKGQPVVLELTTADVFMGFNVPELNLRADIVPGQVARLAFTPEKRGI